MREALPKLTRIAQAVGIDLRGTIVSLDGVYDCRRNRKAIFNRGVSPISVRTAAAARPPSGAESDCSMQPFSRSATIERVLAWEDKFRRVLNRFEVISEVALRLEDPGLQDVVLIWGRQDLSQR